MSTAAPCRPIDARPSCTLRRQLTTVTVAWMFGSIWSNVVSGPSITAFARGLGATHLQFGMLGAIPYIAALLSVPGSLLVECTGQRKRLFLDLFLIQRSLSLVVALAPLLLLAMYGPAAMPHAMSLVLGLLFLMHSTGAAGGPSWVSWMADVVPARIRGAYFANRRQWGIVTAVPAAILIGWGLDRLIGAASPLANVPSAVFWGAALLAVSTFLGLVDILAFTRVPHTPRTPQHGIELVRAMLVPLKDRPFLTFSTFVAVTNFTVGFTNQFATVFVMERLGVDHMHAGLMLIATPMLVQWLLLPAWGAALDRVGRKPLLLLAGIGLVPMAFGWTLMNQAQGMNWLGYVLFAGGMALWTGFEVANFNCVIDASSRCTPDGKPIGGSAYHAVNTVLINIAGCGGGLAAGVIARQLGDWSWQPIASLQAFNFYDVLFTLSGVIRLAAVFFLVPLLIEPNAKSMTVAIRFLCSFMASRITQPLSVLLSRVRNRAGIAADIAADMTETGSVSPVSAIAGAIGPKPVNNLKAAA